MIAKISPSKPSGTLQAPPSKSMAHRQLICAALADGVSTVSGLAFSEDISATIDCLTALGATFVRHGDALRVTGIPKKAALPAGSLLTPTVLSCRESGSTLRFMLPLCLLDGRPYLLKGAERLLQRPLAPYEAICREKGLTFERRPDGILVCGRLESGRYALPGNVSSQFITGLLFALPSLEGDSEILLTTPIESGSYIELTLRALASAGVKATMQSNRIFIPGGQRFITSEVTVEGDYSNAAFFAAMALLGNRVSVTGLDPASAQGDKVYEQYFSAIKNANTPPTLSLADCPDLAPILFTVAALFNGAVFTDTARLRMKESDRGAVCAEELAKFGVKMTVEDNRITVHEGTVMPPSAPLSSHNDHRIAMALTVLCTVTGGEIENCEAVKKSMPDFYERCAALGVAVSFIE